MIRTVLCLPNSIGHMPLALFHGKIFNVPKDCNNGHGAGLESQKLLSKISPLQCFLRRQHSLCWSAETFCAADCSNQGLQYPGDSCDRIPVLMMIIMLL